MINDNLPQYNYNLQDFNVPNIDSPNSKSEKINFLDNPEYFLIPTITIPGYGTNSFNKTRVAEINLFGSFIDVNFLKQQFGKNKVEKTLKGSIFLVDKSDQFLIPYVSLFSAFKRKLITSKHFLSVSISNLFEIAIYKRNDNDLSSLYKENLCYSSLQQFILEDKTNSFSPPPNTIRDYNFISTPEGFYKVRIDPKTIFSPFEIITIQFSNILLLSNSFSPVNLIFSSLIKKIG